VYFSRHYRLRPDAVAPGGPYILGGPRGDLGFLTFAVFIGDNRTFCVVMTTAAGDGDFKGLRTSEGYQAVASRIPTLADWVDPDVAEPITPSLFMGHLTNMIQFVHGESCVRGIRPIGDALSHTNPTFAFGASLSLQQGLSLGRLMADHPDTLDMSEAFEARHRDDLTSRFEAVSAEDVDRQRWWGGEALDPTDPTQSMALAIRFALYPAAARDAELFRAVARRIGALDPIDALPNRTDLVERGLAIRRQMMTGSTPPANPTRDELATAVKLAL
jgi:2-polyprenyl-6-methoxyphenol hydroxylase-like FAD-dependent oxidoreductase